MKIFLIIVGTVLLTSSMFFLIYETTERSERDLAILVHIKDDSEASFVSATLITDNGYQWSCTFRFGVCSIAIFKSGDIGYEIRAIDLSGKLYKQDLKYPYYGVAGSTQDFNTSLLYP